MKAKSLSKQEFLEQVLALKAPTAVFDCDGTLWSKDAGTLFMEWSLEQRLVDDDRAAWIAERHRQYREGLVGEAVMCGEMTTVYAGLREANLLARARDFYREHIAPHVFPEMMELVRKLTKSGTTLWAVSSSNSQMIQAALVDFNIPAKRILATTVRVGGDVLTDELLAVPTGAAKRDALERAGASGEYAAFGNSVHDAAMLGAARWPFAVNPNPGLLELATARGWPVYWPEKQGLGNRD
jgi:phosphoserine phosphatase